jgi:hypothetical protein
LAPPPRTAEPPQLAIGGLVPPGGCVPVCPLVAGPPVTVGLWRLSAKAAPAGRATRQTPIVSEVTRCFILRPFRDHACGMPERNKSTHLSEEPDRIRRSPLRKPACRLKASEIHCPPFANAGPSTWFPRPSAFLVTNRKFCLRYFTQRRLFQQQTPRKPRVEAKRELYGAL